MKLDDEYLEFFGSRDIAFWDGPRGPIFLRANRDFVLEPGLPSDTEDQGLVDEHFSDVPQLLDFSSF